MTSISEFYAGRSVFVTGGTGFMGKVLIEKLLRSCSAIKTIYVLVRPKRGQNPRTRIEELLNTKLFELVSKEHPSFREKIVAISGDILEPALGISPSDEAKLISDVSIVFHTAATVKFDEVLKLSVQMNILGVKKLLELSHKMNKIEAFIHVSTAYANCDRPVIDEVVYPTSLEPQKLIEAMEWMDDDVIATLTPQLMKPRPNSYTYTKSMAECLLIQECGDLPVAIIRPSIVGASWVEPVPGWVDNFNGPTGLFAAIGKGVLRSMQGKFHGKADIIPVDMAINLMIAVGWYTTIERPPTTRVYNHTTGDLNPVTWGHLERASYTYFMKHPLDDLVRIPSPYFTMNKVVHRMKVLVDHYFPAWVLDNYMKLTGRKPIYVRLQDKLWRSVNCLEFFTSNEWSFSGKNVRGLHEKLTEEDRKAFNFDVKRIHWETYLENYCLGTKRYALKEDLAKLPKARQGLLRLQRMNQIFNMMLVLAVWRFLVTRVSIARSVWYFFLAWAVRIFNQLPAFIKS